MIEDQLLNTPEKVELAISHFADLQNHPGWVLLEKMVGANTSLLTDQILAGGESEKEMDRLRDRLAAYKHVINLPKDQVEQLRISNEPPPSVDPYDK